MPLTAADIIVEDGSVVADANSYLELADAQTYFDQRPWDTSWDAATEDLQCRALIYATKVLDHGFIWNGYKTAWMSPMLWPRIWVPNQDATLGYYPAVTQPPNVIIGNTGGLVWPTYLPANYIPISRIGPAVCELILMVLGMYGQNIMLGNQPFQDPAVTSIRLGQGAVELGLEAIKAPASGALGLITDDVISFIGWLGSPRNSRGGGVLKLRRV